MSRAGRMCDHTALPATFVGMGTHKRSRVTWVDYLVAFVGTASLITAVGLLVPVAVDLAGHGGSTGTRTFIAGPKPIDITAVEKRHIQPVDSYIVHLTMTQGTGVTRQKLGTCTGTIIGNETVLTAAHCLYPEMAFDAAIVPGNTSGVLPYPKKRLDVVVTPGLHLSPDGQLVRPFGSCEGTEQRRVADWDGTVGTDVTLLYLASCSDETGSQNADRRAIGTRTGIAPVLSEHPATDLDVPVTMFGYPDSDQYGNHTRSERLFELNGRTCGDDAARRAVVGVNTLVVCPRMGVGASGGPIFTTINGTRTLVSLIGRGESAAALGADGVMSGPLVVIPADYIR